VLKPCPLNRARLKQALALANRGRIPELEERYSEYIVECNSEEVQEKCFELDGWDIQVAGLLEVKWAARKLKWTEMFKLLETELRVEADLAPLWTRTKGVNKVTETAPSPNPPPRQRRQPTKGKGKSNGKGKARAWSPAKGQGKPEAPSPRYPRGGAVAKVYTPGHPDECYPCGREDHAAKHNYWECPYWKADKEKRDNATKEQKGKAPAPKSGAATEPAASSSSK
jgi:hypothetical protein